MKAAETGDTEYDLRAKRLEKCDETRKFLQNLYASLVERDRMVLQGKMNEIFHDIIGGRELANIELTEDFGVRVNELLPDGGIRGLAKSGSQSQINCLSFILSIIAIAEDNLTRTTQIYSTGGVYPLILDSPFGVLAAYRKKVAHSLAKFANQLIVLVAPQQWDASIEGELKDQIKKKVLFLLFGTTKNGNYYSVCSW